ncbi:hypothetical protein NL676_017168 [Syzygium grande]|nr:hypothetical protein NL676_017168 [Syzygium grande]
MPGHESPRPNQSLVPETMRLAQIQSTHTWVADAHPRLPTTKDGPKSPMVKPRSPKDETETLPPVCRILVTRPQTSATISWSTEDVPRSP